MHKEAFLHLIDKIEKTPLIEEPFLHFHIENVFPKDFYQELLDYLPDTECYQSLADSGKVPRGAYKERFILNLNQDPLPFVYELFWGPFGSTLKSSAFISPLIKKFLPHIQHRFKESFNELQFSATAELLRDFSQYTIGPHTDHPMRLMTLLFYFPKSDIHPELGTSLYVPKERQFTCEGLEHHRFEGFEKVKTVPFRPNSLLCFFKSDHSFHGVETAHSERNLLNYYIRWDKKNHPTKDAG